MYENTHPRDHTTGTKCRPDFVAIRIPASGGDVPETVTLEEKVVPAKPTEPKNAAIKLTWSQLEATGEIQSTDEKPSMEQAATYTHYLLQARPDLVSVLGIYFDRAGENFLPFFTDAWNTIRPENCIAVKASGAKDLLVAWIRRLYKPEHSLNIYRMGDFPCKPTFTIKAGYPRDFTDCDIVSVGTGRRRSTIFANRKVVIKSQYFESGRRFEESKILAHIHDPEFPGVVRVLPVPSVQGSVTVEAGSNAPAPLGSTTVDTDSNASAPHGSTVIVGKGGSSHRSHRGNNEVLHTLLVLKDNVLRPFMDAETPLDALIAIYDLLESNPLSSFLE
jgi:hypothetical protein